MINILKSGVLIIGILLTGIFLSCEAKKTPVQSTVQQSNPSTQSEVQETKPVEIIPWDEGFDVSWLGSYKSRSTADC
jgi:c-di-AMP phosphodiesterase-like protein